MTSYPKVVKPGQKFEIKWNVNDANVLDHSNVHWGTQSGNLDRFGSLITKKPFWGTYTNEITAPRTGTIYFRVHAKADGQDVESQEMVINIR